MTAALDPRRHDPVHRACRHGIIVVGYAKVPQTSASRALHEFLSITVRIDRCTGRVTEVDSTAVTGLVRSWIAELLVDVDFRDDIGPVLHEIDAGYLGHAAGSIKQAINDAWRRFAAHRGTDASRSLP